MGENDGDGLQAAFMKMTGTRCGLGNLELYAQNG